MASQRNPYRCRDVTISEISQIKAFVRTMQQRSSSSLSRHIRRFCLLYYEEDLILDLFRTNIEFTDMLQDAHFPNLSEFRFVVSPENRSLLRSFLDRHQTIAGLVLNRLGPLTPLDLILLLNLKSYTGPSSFVPSFTTNRTPLSTLFIVWYPDDLDVEAPLLHLGRIASPDLIIDREFVQKPHEPHAAFVHCAKPCDKMKNLETKAAQCRMRLCTMHKSRMRLVRLLHKLPDVSTSDNLKTATILADVASHLPDITILRVGRMDAAPLPTSRDETLELTPHLGKLTSLLTLEVLGADSSSNANDDRESILAWSGACKKPVFSHTQRKTMGSGI
ncbi:hypothetical protein DFH08DRAFT_824772 [Mycena albidolilacea]|uniref:Uncharacterized protein n=1 Tax=Mycena albidolilacea TaxID=1033008 RepID=A0AAD6Z3X9_9AGAR|nr:hypothetical protein DFH08DRAFT_824772 [Mycena albidolilacea]